MSRPPRVARRLLGALLPRDDRAVVLGDLEEQFVARHARGAAAARLWYWRQTLALPVWLWGARLAHLDVGALEVRPVLRRLLRSPGFTVVAVTSLGIGIGANTAIFGVLRALLFEDLEVAAPQELVLVNHTRPEGFARVSQYNSNQTIDPETGALVHASLSYPALGALQAAAPVGTRVAGFTFVRDVALVDGERPAMAVSGLMVSGNYFETLGLGTALGRPLLPSDDRPGAPPVAVLSHTFWVAAFGGDPGVVGRAIRVNGTPFEVVGVSAAGFDGLSPGGFFPTTEMTVPLSAQPLVVPRWTPPEGSMFTSTDRYWLRILARVPTGTAMAPVREALTAALRQALLDAGTIGPDLRDGVDVVLLPGRRGLDTMPRAQARPVGILTGVVALVLLIACANVATLLIARGAAREHESTVRSALGAGRLHLVWPLFLESLLVAVGGGALGLGVAWWGTALLRTALQTGMGASIDLRMDGGMLLATAGVAVSAALLSGLLPALRSAAVDPARLGVRGSGRPRSRLAQGLIVAQIAISVPLVVGGGLLVRTVSNLSGLDTGFDMSGLTVFRLDPTTVTQDADEAARIYRDVLDNVRAVPGVQGATLVENVLLSGWISNTTVEIDGEPASMYMNAVGPDFLEVLGIPSVAGRALDDRDDADAPRVALVNETAVARLFGGNAVGRTFRVGDHDVRVVGVVADTRYRLRDEVRPTFFDPWLQRGAASPRHVVVRAGGNAAALERGLREAVARAHPGIPVTGLDTQAGHARRAMFRERVFAVLLSVFGGFALLLACIGLHGITAFSVSRRRAEMGVRLALGARPEAVFGLVLRRVVLLVTAGVVLGLAASLSVSPVVGSMLYDVAPRDPTTFVTAAGLLLLVGLVAGWFPAWRASRTDPVEVLQAE